MALVGLRDISSLRTPPQGRLAIQTECHYRDESLMKLAIHRELKRGGQVYYVTNRVNGIERHAAQIEKLVPAARVAIAHGQMAKHELEQSAQDFSDGKVDVLVCTTIIESGIDIPRVNTLIVDRADLFGLADLHQLRGRIGRSDSKAYAYFLIPNKPIPEIALRRLKAIESLSHLGAGFDISIKDLEIRGAGNILGKEQHGHIAAVGYDLYCRLLKRAVERQRGQSEEDSPVDIDVDLQVSALLPTDYIEDEAQRMEMLRRLSSSRGAQNILGVAAEMRDRFGHPPGAAKNLVTLFLLKDRCRELGIRQLFYPGDDFVLLVLFDARRFEARAPLTRDEVRFTHDDQVHLMLPPSVRGHDGVLEYLRRHLLRARHDEPAEPAFEAILAGRRGNGA
jgi:transcription-repair coupling factor (superfamily II helicase)